MIRIGYNRDMVGEFNERFGVIILAAGKSSRMNDFKPLLPVDGMSALEGLIEATKIAGVTDIAVVTGYKREELSDIIAASGAKEIYNENYEDGMFSSIKAGLAGAEEGFDDKEGFLLMPVDCPLISARVLRELMSVAGTETPTEGYEEFAVVTYEGKKGHPLYIPRGYIAEICEYDGPGGLKAITDKYWDRMKRVAVDEEGVILDMDTPEGYQDIINFVSKGFKREKLELLTARKRIFLVRHGETQQHDEPVFIGQYDVPLSDEGRAQALEAAKGIAAGMQEDVEAEMMGMDKFGREPMPAIERIYSSDLSRAAETAEIIKDYLNEHFAMAGLNLDVRYDEGLREINLGAWEGKAISQVQAEDPVGYERRGKEMFTYKTEGAENFYDMQYRVLGAFREILRNDDAKDIIIIAHSGVIRALENNINDLRVDDNWDPIPKGGFRMFTPFPVKNEKPEEDAGEKPMNMNDMTLEACLEYYEQ